MMPDPKMDPPEAKRDLDSRIQALFLEARGISLLHLTKKALRDLTVKVGEIFGLSWRVTDLYGNLVLE